ncbi:septin-4-like isoform X2 [Watersipora subatra]|uniref:septin-4-like isoform X2 n=1 Tax=Watersipora subatra TaxID=2589382 RepID=UPI00355AE539
MKDQDAVHGKPRRKLTQQIIYGKEEDCIGFATLPDQIHRKVIKKGFHFTIMVVGESGLGKSTLINSLFMTDLYKDKKALGVEDRLESTVKVESQNIDIEEAGVKLRLTIIDTPGFSDSLHGEDSIQPVEEYIDSQFHQYYEAESGLNRKNIQDSRVHCLLYFISPYGHGLKPLDVECLKRLHNKVNIIPLIAKADTLTQAEVARNKAKVLEDIKVHGIKVYDFPDCDPDEDEEFKRQDAALKAAIPFAVIGSNAVTEVRGKRIRARVYPWGIIEVENEEHSDFTKLKRMLIGTHLQDLKDVTEEYHYENYRANYIQSTENNNISEKRQPLSFQKPGTSGHNVDQLLSEKDEEIKKMQAMLEAMQRQMAQNTV